MKQERRHPQLDGWVRLMSKGLVSHLQIYDTGQQEAWLCWLLLKYFGHHVTYPMSKGVLWFGALHDNHMLWQQKIWLYGAFYKSTIMMLFYDLFDGEMRRQQRLLLLWLLLGEYGLIFSHTLHDILGVEDGTIIVQRGYSSDLED